MRRSLVVALASLVSLTACASSAEPTPAPTLSFPPLPAALADVEPRPGEPRAELAPRSRRGAEVGATYRFRLEHCGLASPIDFDGSLWDVLGVATAEGAQVTDESQTGELINATSGTITLVAPESARFLTPSGVVVTLFRHAGPKRYHLCQ